MLRITETANALHYFRSALAQEDYYSQGNEFPGIWHGKLAAKLGLSNQVNKEDFHAICHNLHPDTGEKLKPRNRKDAVSGWDFTVSVPKSVSLLYGLMQDQAILDTFHQAACAMLNAIEADIRTRVRTKGRNQDRTTAHMLSALFVHTTSRPVDGTEDPHLHGHAWIPNLTYDDHEQRYKAAKMRYIWDQAPYYESLFDKHMITGLRELGYGIEHTSTGWELGGISRDTIDKFSRRTKQIEQVAAEKQILSNQIKSTLGGRTRNRKRTQMDPDALRESWWERLSDEEQNSLSQLRTPQKTSEQTKLSVDPDQAVEYACNICFKRCSLISDKRIAAAALEYAKGWLGPEEIFQALNSYINTHQVKTIYGTMGQLLLSMPTSDASQKKVFSLIKVGFNSCQPLSPKWSPPTGSRLTEPEIQSLQQILSSYNRVLRLDPKHSLNPTFIQEVWEAAKQAGKKIYPLSPTLSANPSAIVRLLREPSFQKQLSNQIAWIDLSTELDPVQLEKLLVLTQKGHSRVILSNSTYQQYIRGKKNFDTMTSSAQPVLKTKATSHPSQKPTPSQERALVAARLARLSLVYANEFSHNLSMTR